MVLPDDAPAMDSERPAGPSPVATKRNVRAIVSDNCPPTIVSGRAPITVWQLGLASVTIRLMFATTYASEARAGRAGACCRAAGTRVSSIDRADVATVASRSTATAVAFPAHGTRVASV